jgi:hypothetical protein
MTKKKPTVLETLIDSLVMESLPRTPVGPFKIGQFRNLKSTRERLQYLKTRDDSEFISDGSSRIVFSVSNDMVLKVSKWNRGKAQNKSEADAVNCGNPKYLPGLYAKGSDFSWILVEAVEPLKSAKQFESLKGFHPEMFFVGMSFTGAEFKRNRKASNPTYKRYEALHTELAKKNKWYRGLISMAIKCDLVPGDIAKWDSWGVSKRGRVVLIDYGLTEGVWKQYYSRTAKNLYRILTLIEQVPVQTIYWRVMSRLVGALPYVFCNMF